MVINNPQDFNGFNQSLNANAYVILKLEHKYVRIEVFTSVTMKNTVFYDVAPYVSSQWASVASYCQRCS
jgi:hypothetical protein